MNESQLNIPAYPGTPLRPGDTGDTVRQIQIQLSRIARNYPSIPQVEINGIYDDATSLAVQEFQRIFNLPVDGNVGKRTWYRLNYVFALTKNLAQLVADLAYPPEDYQQLPEALSPGDAGRGVIALQFLLSWIAAYNIAVPPLDITGRYGQKTLEAVNAFKATLDLPQDGIVDAQTWDALLEAYLGIQAQLPPDYLSVSPAPYPGAPLQQHSKNVDVQTAQTYLKELPAIYPEIPPILPNGTFGQRTYNAVVALQQQICLPIHGLIDRITWDSLIMEADNVPTRRLPLQYPAINGATFPVDAVQELHAALHAVAAAYPEAPPVSDAQGVYGKNTAAAVAAFQRRQGLPVTGIADLDTWNALHEHHRHLQRQQHIQDTTVFGGQLPLKPGDTGDAVLALQTLLDPIAASCSNLNSGAINGHYHPDTAQCVADLQEICTLPVTGIVDAFTLEWLLHLYNHVLQSALPT